MNPLKENLNDETIKLNLFGRYFNESAASKAKRENENAKQYLENKERNSRKLYNREGYVESCPNGDFPPLQNLDPEKYPDQKENEFFGIRFFAGVSTLEVKLLGDNKRLSSH